MLLRTLRTTAALASFCLLPGVALAGFAFPSIDGGSIDLDSYKGHPVLVVNTASLCGFAPQFADMQELQDTYADQGLVVLAVPSDDFKQELNDAKAVKEYCAANFDLTLPMTDITHVLGDQAHPFYAWLAAERGFLMLHQYENAGNPGAHELTTGPEIIDQTRELGHERIDAFVATLGTGGTVTGVARALRPVMPEARVVAAEPPSGELIAGLRSLDDGYIPPIFDPSLLGGKILVRTEDSIRMARRVLSELGWFIGPSAGAAVHASLKVASRLDPGSVVVTVLCDGGWKYLSTGVFSGTVEEATARVLGTTLW